jgi:hypothetical protein
MATTETILIILLAVGFIVLLVLAIAVVTLLISILRAIKRITTKAENATESISGVAMMLGKRLAPVAFSAGAAAILRKFKKGKEDK